MVVVLLSWYNISLTFKSPDAGGWGLGRESYLARSRARAGCMQEQDRDSRPTKVKGALDRAVAGGSAKIESQYLKMYSTHISVKVHLSKRVKSEQ